jgi:hypothetical protein
MEASGAALNSRLEFETKPGVVFLAEYTLRRF